MQIFKYIWNKKNKLGWSIHLQSSVYYYFFLELQIICSTYH